MLKSVKEKHFFGKMFGKVEKMHYLCIVKQRQNIPCKGSSKLSGGATPLAVSATLNNGRLERNCVPVGLSKTKLKKGLVTR